MKLFDVYPLVPINIVKAKNCKLWDDAGREYLDLYGGHAVISIGHSHPHYVQKISDQLQKIGFYSNSLINSLQTELAEKLGKISGYDNYNLFLCNSGAEANENAFKVASFTTGKKKFISLQGSFHGRTSASVAATDDPSIKAPVNESENFIFCRLNNIAQLEQIFKNYHEQLAGIIVEGIQGISGIREISKEFMDRMGELCLQYGVFFISDEVQSGYGRSGKFSAHEYFDIKPDIISLAKGMGNGFPVAGVLLSPKIKAKHKMLGTTFGGNHLACSAAIAVLDVLENENLISEAQKKGEYLKEKLKEIEKIKAVRGKGLMIGIDFEVPSSGVSKILREDYAIFTGSASTPQTMRLLPPLTVSTAEIDYFLSSLKQALKKGLV